jgi:pimeloyl-ACP methyl ester carboxylesterase
MADGHRLECAWFMPEAPGPKPDSTIVMLHEGLGSLSMWKGFPAQLAEMSRTRVLAYSRYGYGKSEVLAGRRDSLSMHEHEALVVLPELLEKLGISRSILFGHSDGASIALIHAASTNSRANALIVLAPHVNVEPMCLEAIRAARHTYLSTDLRSKLARYHDNPDSAFWGWNDLWLDPVFPEWSISSRLPRIACPILAIQGYQDEYGTMAQLDTIARARPGTAVVKLENCGHSPHRDQPEKVLDAVSDFLAATHMYARDDVLSR